MKSLSVVVLLGTLTALTVGALLAITPVFADNSQPAPVALDTNASSEIVAAPNTVTVAEPAISVQVLTVNMPPAAEDPGVVLASTFSTNFAKDTASAASMQAAEVQAASFDSFVASVSNGKTGQVTGLYVDGAFAYSVGRQPSGNASYVTENANEVTLFGLAGQYGSQAFLAHNYLAGAAFSSLTAGQVVTVVYGDGSTASFRIEAMHRFQALSPESTQSRFVDLESGEELSASSLFYNIYNNDNTVVLQTCIENDGISTWGRLFVVATPISSDPTADTAGDQTGAVEEAGLAVTGNTDGNLLDGVADTLETATTAVQP